MEEIILSEAKSVLSQITGKNETIDNDMVNYNDDLEMELDGG